MSFCFSISACCQASSASLPNRIKRSKLQLTANLRGLCSRCLIVVVKIYRNFALTFTPIFLSSLLPIGFVNIEKILEKISSTIGFVTKFFNISVLDTFSTLFTAGWFFGSSTFLVYILGGSSSLIVGGLWFD